MFSIPSSNVFPSIISIPSFILLNGRRCSLSSLVGILFRVRTVTGISSNKVITSVAKYSVGVESASMEIISMHRIARFNGSNFSTGHKVPNIFTKFRLVCFLSILRSTNCISTNALLIATSNGRINSLAFLSSVL